jgi:hypothetical protein
MLARHVVIVGGPAGVSGEDEAQLRAAGCDVHRLAGADEAETKAMLDALVTNNTPWPGADPLSRQAPASLAPFADTLPVPEPDAWTVPDRFADVSIIATPTGKYQRVYADTLLFPHQSD